MNGRAATFLGAIAIGAGAVIAAQAPATIDFRRDVMPILRDRCYSCHGPEQQMNGFRLDRRADAMRGGSQPVIGPGNADGSRFYRRLTGTTVGARMPPTGPLEPNQIGVLKAWIDQGAIWPDDLSGEVPVPAVDADAERLAALIRDGDRHEIEQVLRNNPRAVRGRTQGGSTPLMFAALYGDAALVRRLLKSGADPVASNAAGATALMWAVPSIDKMRLLLAAGVNADARSEDGRTALLIAAGTTDAGAAVELLLEYGASPYPAIPSDTLPLREAARLNNADAFGLLVDYGADPGSVPADLLRNNCVACAVTVGVGAPGPLPPRREPVDTGLRPLLPPSPPGRAVAVSAVTPDSIRAAVERALPLIQRTTRPFIQKTGCVSCHHNSVGAMAVAAARRNGYRVDEAAVSEERMLIANYLEAWRERTLQNKTIAGAQDTVGYVMVGLGASGHAPDKATDAQGFWLLKRQSSDGRWPLGTLRPPIESNDIEVTVMAMRALQLYAPRSARVESAKAVARARDWLLAAVPEVTEERAFRMLGVVWAGANREAITSAGRALQGSQRPDGGWSQQASMQSDAYATGEALVALAASGLLAKGDPAIRRGVDFLLRRQLEDGSWFVKSRSVPIQAYFESGFPHGADQWISAAATAWAVTALVDAERLGL